MLRHDQRSTQRYHHQRTKNTAKGGDHHDREHVKVTRPDPIAEKDEGGQRKDDASCDALTCRAAGLNDVVLENRRLQEPFADRDGQHRNRNRSRYGQAGF